MIDPDHYLRILLDLGRSSQGGAFIRADLPMCGAPSPDVLPESWTTQIERLIVYCARESRSLLRVLTNEGREHLARVADESQHRRSWGARLVREWRMRGKPTGSREDIAAEALYRTKGDPVAAREFVPWCKDEFGECVCGECWSIETDLLLARLSYTEAFECWCWWARRNDGEGVLVR